MGAVEGGARWLLGERKDWTGGGKQWDPQLFTKVPLQLAVRNLKRALAWLSLSPARRLSCTGAGEE